MESCSWADNLRLDHERFGDELGVLKTAENRGDADLWPTLRGICARLSSGLLEHIRREEMLMSEHSHSLGAASSEAMNRSSRDHYSDYRYLQVITRCIASEDRPLLLNSRRILLANYLRELKGHMNEQEREHFPTNSPIGSPEPALMAQ